MSTIPPSPARDQKLAAILAKCVEANPEIVTPASMYCTCGVVLQREYEENRGQGNDWCPKCTGKMIQRPKRSRPIRLADVLLAVEELTLDRLELLAFWNLRDDDLTHQPDDCIDFLFSLLS